MPPKQTEERLITVGPISDEKLLTFVGLPDNFKKHVFADYDNTEKIRKQLERFALDLTRMDDRIFYPYYNYSVTIDNKTYELTAVNKVKVPEAWNTHMTDVTYTTTQIMAEMDLTNIKKALENVTYTMMEEKVLTAAQLRDNTAAVILKDFTSSNMTEVFINALLKALKHVHTDDEIKASVVKPESCEAYTTNDQYVKHCVDTFTSPDQIETKTLCLKKFGVKATPQYCLESLKVKSDKFYYPIKNKYKCLTNPKMEWKVKIDSEAARCLNLYHSFQVENCLVAYEAKVSA